MAQTTLRMINPSHELHPESQGMARPTKAARRRAALLGIRRKKRSGTRKGQRRKTARRAYTGLAKRRSNPRRSTRKGQRRRTARRAYMKTAAPGAAAETRTAAAGFPLIDFSSAQASSWALPSRCFGLTTGSLTSPPRGKTACPCRPFPRWWAPLILS